MIRLGEKIKVATLLTEKIAAPFSNFPQLAEKG
jgi:hypothetical protein